MIAAACEIQVDAGLKLLKMPGAARTHRCHIFEHTGESYRFRESLQRQAAQV